MATSPVQRWIEPFSAYAEAAWAKTRQHLSTEWSGLWLHRTMLDRPAATSLGHQPRDFRPTQAWVGQAMLNGRIELANVTLDTGPHGDPWDMPSPSRRFAVALHRFDWLPHLLTQGETGAREGLRLFIAWRAVFEPITPFVWSPETLERRVFNLACGARPMADAGSEMEGRMLAVLLARQARRLAEMYGPESRELERLTAAAVAGTALADPAGGHLLSQVMPRLVKLLDHVVLPDGGVKSRCPEQSLELLLDLLTLDDGLALRGQGPPPELSRAIDHLMTAVRFFQLNDGRLAAFQGGEAASAERIAAALAHDSQDTPAYRFAPHTGYQRMTSKLIDVMVDTGPPAVGPWSVAACAQPLALEVVCDGDRLITNCGWTPENGASPAFRTTAAGSTASLGDQSCGLPVHGFVAEGLGPRLMHGATVVHVERNESDQAVWLDLRHDAWEDRFHITHERRLFLEIGTEELRGEDRFEPAADTAHRRNVRYTVRFHLAADVQASLARDGRSVMLRGPSDKGWWLRNDAADVALESSVQFVDGAPKRTLQVVLTGAVPTVGDGARVRWKLTRVKSAAETIQRTIDETAE